MKIRIVMLVALVCAMFSPSEAKAPACPDFWIENASNCPIKVDVIWDCGGGNYVTVPVGVNANSSNFASNPGSPNCCTFYKVVVYWPDGSGGASSLGPGMSDVIPDCNGGWINIEVLNGGTGDYLYIY